MSRVAIAEGQYQEFRRRLLLDEPDIDERTLADTLEGLTDLHEILAAVIREALFDEALCSGLKQRIDQMEDRQRRLDNRAAKRRQLVRDVMVENAIKKLVDPEFTVSIRAGTASVVIVDEFAIPSKFWEPREPRLDRQMVWNALKGGVDIPGAMLSNPEPVMSVRTR